MPFQNTLLAMQQPVPIINCVSTRFKSKPRGVQSDIHSGQAVETFATLQGFRIEKVTVKKNELKKKADSGPCKGAL